MSPFSNSAQALFSESNNTFSSLVLAIVPLQLKVRRPFLYSCSFRLVTSSSEWSLFSLRNYFLFHLWYCSVLSSIKWYAQDWFLPLCYFLSVSFLITSDVFPYLISPITFGIALKVHAVVLLSCHIAWLQKKTWHAVCNPCASYFPLFQGIIS